MKILWLHLRNSPIRWALPAFFALVLAVLLLRSHYWIGIWPETGAAAQVPAPLLGAPAAAAAAWAAGTPHRFRLDEQVATAQRSLTTVETYRLAATAIIILIPYLAGHAIAFVLTARTFPPGLHLWLGYVALGVFALLLATAAGWVLGRLFSTVFAALVAALGWLLFVAGAGQWAQVHAVTGRPSVMVDQLSITLLLTLTLTLLALLPWLRRAGDWHTTWRSARLPAAAGTALAVTLLAAPVIVDREPVGAAAMCVENERTELCIWPEHEKYLPQLRKVGARIDALPETFTIPSRFVEDGVEPRAYVEVNGELLPTDGDNPQLHILEGSVRSLAGTLASGITGATWGDCGREALAGADEQQLFAIDAWLESYLAGGAPVDYQTNAPPRMREGWAIGRGIADTRTVEDQLRWAGSQVSQVHEHHC